MKITKTWNSQTRDQYAERNEKIFQEWLKGATYSNIAAEFGISVWRVTDILKRKKIEKGWYTGYKNKSSEPASAITEP